MNLQTLLSIPITQKCQILSCDTLVASGFTPLYFRTFSFKDSYESCSFLASVLSTVACIGFGFHFAFVTVLCFYAFCVIS
jgi:hypothetical protein